ncbi:MAG: [acyl-carrier-protein] S-malonyltransferase [Candidatus Cloacimonadota bacterium]|nr:MAG: [acyl-carrier-protein] S-malonyltransferase [Candidatus Cloacimonadota bacterium]
MSLKNHKIAFIFPGQGAQYVGMASDFTEDRPELKNVLEQFDKENNVTLAKIMADGPSELLKETRFTQPALLFHGVVAMQKLQSALDIKPDYVAGHSLGEFTALVANGVLSLEDAMYLVHKRGEFMIEANDGQPFGMAAVMGLSGEKVSQICKEASEKALVVAANFNTPVQTVVSGTKEGVELACSMAKEAGAKRVVMLEVGGPFHSPLIAKAGEMLTKEMEKITFNETDIPVVSNVDAEPQTNISVIKSNLAKQVISSVYWVDCIEKMIEEGVDVFFEFGPKKVLAGMIKKINRKVKVYGIDKLEDVEKVLEGVNEL